MGKLKANYGSNIEWFENFADWPEEVYGAWDLGDHWRVMVKITTPYGGTTVETVTEAPDRETAIGYIKLLKEE